MNWYDRLLRRKPKDVIPNPRDKRKKADDIEAVQRGVLNGVQVFVFMLAILLLAAVS